MDNLELTMEARLEKLQRMQLELQILKTRMNDHLGYRNLTRLIDDLRNMETVDPFNGDLRERAEKLLAEFERMAEEFSELEERTFYVRGSTPELYAQFYIGKAKPELKLV
jgi:hypothetical protein